MKKLKQEVEDGLYKRYTVKLSLRDATFGIRVEQDYTNALSRPYLPREDFVARSSVVINYINGVAECIKGLELLNDPARFGLGVANPEPECPVRHLSNVPEAPLLWWQQKQQEQKVQRERIIALHEDVRRIVGR